MPRITKWSIKPRKRLNKKAPIDAYAKCPSCHSNAPATKQISPRDGMIIVVYSCGCGTKVTREYRKAPSFDHQDCAEVL